MTVIPSLNMVVAARGDWGEFAPGDPSSEVNLNLKLLADAVSGTPPPGGGPLNVADVSPDVVAPGSVAQLTVAGSGFQAGA